MAEAAHEFTGKTVDEAVAEGLSKLNVSRSDVAVEVLSKGSRGIFGIGSEPARVRITVEPARKATRPAESAAKSAVQSAEPSAAASAQDTAEPVFEEEAEVDEELSISPETHDTKPAASADTEEEEIPPSTQAAAETDVADDELATMASEMLGEVVRLMGFEADIVASWQDPDDSDGPPYLVLDIEGKDLGALIGRRGETLASMQYLIRLMVNQRIKQWRNIVVDVENYKERRVAQLNQLALRMAEQVAESGRAVALEPMPPNERRIVHLALRDHPQVYTQSSGDGERRKVHIVPKDTV